MRAVQLSETCPSSPDVAARPAGGVLGWPRVLADQALKPPALCDLIWNSYVVVLVNPVTVRLVPAVDVVVVQLPTPLVRHCTW